MGHAVKGRLRPLLYSKVIASLNWWFVYMEFELFKAIEPPILLIQYNESKHN